MSSISETVKAFRDLEENYSSTKMTEHVQKCLELSLVEIKQSVKEYLQTDIKKIEIFFSFILKYLKRIERDAYEEFSAVFLPESGRITRIIQNSTMSDFLRQVGAIPFILIKRPLSILSSYVRRTA